MPYFIREFDDGYKVCKKSNPNKCFSKKTLTKEQAKKQMKAIGMSSRMKEKSSEKFDGNILMLGIGAVAKSVLHLIENFISFDPKKLYMIDLIDYSEHPDVDKFIKKGAIYTVGDINKYFTKMIDNLDHYDLVIDLSCGTDSKEILKRCKIRNVHYINTSLEDEKTVFEMKKEGESFERTFQQSHNEINEIKKMFIKNKATSIIVHGMNPGLITSFIKYSILFLAYHEKNKSEELKMYVKNREYNKICRLLKIATIHCSETDSAHFTNGQKLKEFTNTWCVDGLVQEASANCEFTYGSNQLELPKDGHLINDHIIVIDKPSLEIYNESFVPRDGVIIGMVIPHSEGISTANFFSDGAYCPTQNYVYKIAPLAVESIKKFYKDENIGKNVEYSHVLNNYEDNFEQIDRVGALVLTEDKKAVWCGSMLNNKEENVGLHSGTTQQVSCSVLSAIKYMLKNKDLGILFPEEIDEDFIIEECKPYLGEFICEFVDYKPKSLQFKDLQKTKQQFLDQFKPKYAEPNSSVGGKKKYHIDI